MEDHKDECISYRRVPAPRTGEVAAAHVLPDHRPLSGLQAELAKPLNMGVPAVLLAARGIPVC